MKEWMSPNRGERKAFSYSSQFHLIIKCDEFNICFKSTSAPIMIHWNKKTLYLWLFCSKFITWGSIIMRKQCIVEELMDEAQAGIKIAGRNINNLRYADDTTLMPESEEELNSLLMKLKEEGEKVGLKLNIQKTNIMVSCPITSWQIDGNIMKNLSWGTFYTITDLHFSKNNEVKKSKFSSVQFSHLVMSDSSWSHDTARQASLSITNSRSLLKLISTELVMLSNHLILCCPILLLPPIPPSIRVFSNESALPIRWPKYWSFIFNISPSNEHSGLISLRMDWLDPLAVNGLPRVFSNTTVQKHQFLSTQLSL